MENRQGNIPDSTGVRVALWRALHAQIDAAPHVIEDQPATQEWKRRQLLEVGLGISAHLRFVPVNFEARESWLANLKFAGFNPNEPAVVSSTGVSMYLTREASHTTWRQLATLAKGSVVAMSFIPPLDLIDPAERPALTQVYERAKAAGTPFVCFFTPSALMDMAREAGFRQTSISPAPR